jgi:hypothetical protein
MPRKRWKSHKIQQYLHCADQIILLNQTYLSNSCVIYRPKWGKSAVQLCRQCQNVISLKNNEVTKITSKQSKQSKQSTKIQWWNEKFFDWNVEEKNLKAEATL